MSYDLNFYKRKTNPISKTDIERYLNELPNETNENGTQWLYENTETGAYCIFEYFKSDDADEEIENYEEFEDTKFAFTINFIRPQFFGKECFPIVDKIAHDLNLYILNPQGEGVPMKYEKGLLEKEWAESNLKFAKINFVELGLGYLELEKSNYAWDFCFNRVNLQKELGENYFVPGIFYFKQKRSNTVETISVWPEHIPYVLPQVDYILIQKKFKKLFKTKKEDGLIRYDDVISNLGQFFEERETYLILHPENATKISKIFNELPLIGSFEAFGEGVTVDNFVNTSNK